MSGIQGVFLLNTIKPQPRSGEQNKTEMGLRKMFGTGTMLESKILQVKNESTFAVVSDPVAAATAVQFQPTINPSFDTKLSLTLSQPLWRNFNAREIDYAKMSATGNVTHLEHQANIVSQMSQFETESLYWNLLSLQAQRTLIKRLVDNAGLTFNVE